MKKILLKLLSLLMALVLVFGMAACSTEDKEDKKDSGKKEETIVGKWKCDINFMEIMGESMDGEEMLEYFDFTDVNVSMYTEFKDDGTYETYVTDEDIEAFVDDLKEMMTNGMTAYLEDMIEQSGQDISIEDVMVGSGYDSIADMIDDAVQSMLTEEMLEDFNEEGYYVVEGNKLYMSEDDDIDKEEDDAGTFELDGDELTVNDPSIAITLKFKRVK